MLLPRSTWIVFAYAAALAIAPAQPAFDQLRKSLKPAGYVTDLAKVLSASQEQQLEQLLTELEHATTAEIAVVTLPSLEGGEISDFANRLFEQWRIGKRGKDNGILLLAAIEDRKVWIEVGYGLEALIPDARAGRILDESVIPYFRKGQVDQGIVEGTMALAGIVARNANVRLGNAPPRSSRSTRRPGIASWLCPIAFLVILFILFRKNPLLAGMLLAGSRPGHRSHRGGHFGGGGFGGSGGFGGGGFGGFGGGSSGGGGAGRSW